MEDEKLMKQAKQVYDTICKSLDARGWKYTEHVDDLVITCGARGEDLPMFSPMPYKIAEN